MDIVSFETAKKLKDAGFPQPEYIQLGFGYTDDGSRFYIEDCSFPKGGVGGMCYAPTATDILRKMPDGYAIYRVNLDMFICKNDMPLPGDERCFTSAAEAVAFVWLSENTRMFKMKITGDAWKHQL